VAVKGVVSPYPGSDRSITAFLSLSQCRCNPWTTPPPMTNASGLKTFRSAPSPMLTFSIVNSAKDAVEISDELQISLSSTYKALTNLEKLSLVEIQRFKMTDAGKKIKLYRSRIKKANISISENKSEVTLYPNN